MNRSYQKPDLNAPRFRPKKLNLTNARFYNAFVEQQPRYGDVTLEQFKEVIDTFNTLIWQTVIERRDGVELPEQLGYLFIGSCPRKKGENIDYRRSAELGMRVQFQNWESDQYTAKIIYTNYETKYRFKHHDLWGFEAHRDFKRTVGATYPKEWNKYVVMDDVVRASMLFRKQQYRQLRSEQEKQDLLHDYDEFRFD